MSCCGGNCGCGSSCSCGSGCRGCRIFPDISVEKTTGEMITAGVAPLRIYYESAEMSFGAEGGCKCGSNCTCDPCTC